MNIHPQPEFRNHTLIVTVSSDDGRPVLDRRAYESLAKTFHEAAIDDNVRVVVLRGLAGCFCLGGDFSEFLDATKHQQLIAAVTDMFRTLATFPKPVLACVDGDAVGVGCTILFHCDMVIASTKARSGCRLSISASCRTRRPASWRRRSSAMPALSASSAWATRSCRRMPGYSAWSAEIVVRRCRGSGTWQGKATRQEAGCRTVADARPAQGRHRRALRSHRPGDFAVSAGVAGRYHAAAAAADCPAGGMRSHSAG